MNDCHARKVPTAAGKGDSGTPACRRPGGEHVQESPAVSPVTHKLRISKDSLLETVLKDGSHFRSGPCGMSAGPLPGPGAGFKQAGREDGLAAEFPGYFVQRLLRCTPVVIPAVDA